MRACVHLCGLLCFLVVVLCSCSRGACLCAHLWGGKRSFAREEPIYRAVWASKAALTHCSGAFRSHDMIHYALKPLAYG